jgi:hypothetical protein
MTPTPGTKYRHYKGDCYTVLAITTDTETHQPRVIYGSGGKIWDRVLNGTSPLTGKPCGWNDPLPDGTPRFTPVN